MRSINDIQEDIISEFFMLEDWLDRYQLLIDRNQSSVGVPPQDKIDANLIEGCQSKVWVTARLSDGLIYYATESNTEIAGGIADLLREVLSGHTPSEIIESDLYFIDKIGLREHLSPTRSNGMLAMIRQMRLYALAFQSQQSQS